MDDHDGNEVCLPNFVLKRHSLICNVICIAFVVVMLMNAHIFFPIFSLWQVIFVLFLLGIFKRYASFEMGPRAQASSNGYTEEEEVHVPTFVRREQLPDIRIQIAELGREFNDSDYDALRALDEDIPPSSFAMSEDDINTLPTYKYQAQNYSTAAKANDLVCSICLDQVQKAEVIRRLPCSHEFHANCISPWLRQQGTCPICKCRPLSRKKTA